MPARIAVFTGGGDAPGLNAVIRAVTRTAILNYGWEVYGIRDGLEGVLLDRPDGVVRLNLHTVSEILPRGGTILGTVNRADPRLYTVQGGRTVVTDWAKERLRSWVKGQGIKGVVAIGGDGTMNIGYQLFEAGIPLVGVPKTIDNDLMGTDLTFGFDSAIDVATDALDRLRTTARSHKRVMVLEVMGRNAGWIALHAGVAGGAHVILLPEISFRLEAVCHALRQRWQRGSQYALVVVAEGAYPVGGAPIYHEIGGKKRLGGVGEWLAQCIYEVCGYEARAVVLGHLQRGGSPSAFDRILATQYGVAAVRCVASGTFGVMVGLHGKGIQHVPLSDVVGRQKIVAPDDPLVDIARDLGVAFGDEGEDNPA
ncbi:MAG: ATP-dependent 6-phosphofructokinase [Ardenticatenia bacterium]|nr:ATP-dependent 6-phosphofructokinase [Ardenticatenia bacterium]